MNTCNIIRQIFPVNRSVSVIVTNTHTRFLWSIFNNEKTIMIMTIASAIEIVMVMTLRIIVIVTVVLETRFYPGNRHSCCGRSSWANHPCRPDRWLWVCWNAGPVSAGVPAC
jgi:hypothetical protein